jgi:hypothetical protein
LRTRSLLVLVLALLASAVPVRAHFAERTDSLYGFVARSDLVVIGKVERAERFEEKGHTTLPGAVRVRVEEVLHGTLAAPDLGVLIQGMHQPRYAEGERVLLFAERQGEIFRSLQSRSEKVSAAENASPELLAVRRYVRIVTELDPPRRLRALKETTLDLLRSPIPRLHQDAVFDLSREKLLDAALTDRELVSLGELGRDEDAPLVVREGIAAKLGVLARAGRAAATAPLMRLGRDARNPAVRVAALGAIARSGRTEGEPVLAGAVDASDRFVRLAAVEGLGTLRARSAISRIAGRLDDPDPRIAYAAIEALARIGGPEAESALLAFRERGTAAQQRQIDLAAARLHANTMNPEDSKTEGGPR